MSRTLLKGNKSISAWTKEFDTSVWVCSIGFLDMVGLEFLLPGAHKGWIAPSLEKFLRDNMNGRMCVAPGSVC